MDTSGVRIGTVWDRTVEVMQGRVGILASIAALTLLVPTVVRDAATLALGEGTAGLAVTVVLGLTTLLLTIFGSLALTAVASDPAVDRGGALRIAAAAFPSTLLVFAVLACVFLVLFVPGAILLAQSGIDMAGAARGAPQAIASPGAFGGFTLYMLVYAIFLLWASARLVLIYPVIVNERAGLGSIRRSYDLTRGLAWKIVGVVILYAIVLLVVLSAATTVVGTILRLMLGGDAIATVALLVGLVGAAVTMVFGILQAVFQTRLYFAAREEREGVAQRL